jgi:two-component system, NarL family, sensor histidine kinase UhpB
MARRDSHTLVHRILSAQEAESKRIVRELHDNLGQCLTALRLELHSLELQCSHNESAQQCLVELKRLANEAGRELHRIASEVWPMALDDLGLRQAIIQELDECAERSRLHIDHEIALDESRLSEDMRIAVFRILQGAVADVRRRPGVTRISVIMTEASNELRLIVQGDGQCGHEASEGVVLDASSNEGSLLAGERVTQVGGSFEVEESLQEGTTIFVRLPRLGSG